MELLCEKTQEVSSILEETVLPTYVYSRVYHRGSVLERHRDRDACEISLTLHLGSDKPWEIYIESPKGEERCVNLRPGDAMLYLGKVADHWRNEFSGEYYTQVFLHYVRSRGDCAYTYFDKCKNEEESKLEGIGDIKENKKDIEIKENNLVLNPKPSNTLEQYIHVFDNILSEELCDMIFEEYANSDEWVDTLVGPERNLNKNVRNCRELLLSNSEVIKNNHDKRLKIDKMIHESVNKVIREYTKIHENFSIDIDTGYTLLKYEEGEFYIEHTDSFKQQQRSLSCSIHLNEDYMGGEFAFFGREMMIKSKKGSAIVFPSNFMYPHEVMPVTQGTRYSIITWLV